MYIGINSTITVGVIVLLGTLLTLIGINSTITAGVIVLLGTLLTLFLNEEHKRSFHFIEKTWDKKYSLFEEIISKVYLSSDYYFSVFSIRKIDFKDPIKGWGELRAQIEATTIPKGDMPVSESDYQKIVTMKREEISSNLTFLNQIKNELMYYYERRIYRLSNEFQDLVSKLNLLIWDTEIVKETQSLMEFMLESGLTSRRGEDIDLNSFSEITNKRANKAVMKMRVEMIETLQEKNLDKIKKRMELKK